MHNEKTFLKYTQRRLISWNMSTTIVFLKVEGFLARKHGLQYVLKSPVRSWKTFHAVNLFLFNVLRDALIGTWRESIYWHIHCETIEFYPGFLLNTVEEPFLKITRSEYETETIRHGTLRCTTLFSNISPKALELITKTME